MVPIFLLKENIKEIHLKLEESFHNNFISYVALFLKTGILYKLLTKGKLNIPSEFKNSEF